MAQRRPIDHLHVIFRFVMLIETLRIPCATHIGEIEETRTKVQTKVKALLPSHICASHYSLPLYLSTLFSSTSAFPLQGYEANPGSTPENLTFSFVFTFISRSGFPSLSSYSSFLILSPNTLTIFDSISV